MYAIQINHRLARDVRGCVYKYSTRAVAEIKGRLMVANMIGKEFKVIEL